MEQRSRRDIHGGSRRCLSGFADGLVHMKEEDLFCNLVEYGRRYWFCQFGCWKGLTKAETLHRAHRSSRENLNRTESLLATQPISFLARLLNLYSVDGETACR